MPGPQAAPHWKVTGVQSDRTGTDANGNVITGYVVTFVFDDGTNGQVFIPDALWGSGQEQALISQAVDVLAGVRYAEGGGG